MDEAQESEEFNQQNLSLLKSQFPLHSAIRDGDLEMTISLLNSGRFDLYEEDGFYGWTPSHWAAHLGKLDCLMKLIEHGSSCDAATLRLNQTPAHIAALSGKLHCLKWLLDLGATLSRQDYLGETPLHKAARSGSMECVSLLTSHGCSLGIRNHSGHTASQVAAIGGFNECALALEKSLQFQEQAMAANIIHTYSCNNNNNNNQGPALGDMNGDSHKEAHSGSVLHEGETTCLSLDDDIGCDMDTGSGTMSEQVNGFHATNGFHPSTQNGFSVSNGVHSPVENGAHATNGFHMPTQNGFCGTKRGRDDLEEEVFKRRRFEERCSSHKDEATSDNNNILSSYNAVLAISASPSTSTRPESQLSDVLHAEARVISPCSMDQDQSHPTTPMPSNGFSCHVTNPNQEIPVKCLTLHSHMI